MTRPRTITSGIAAALLAAIGLGATVITQGTQIPAPQPADLVLRGGRIITLDERTPTAQALAVAQRRDRVRRN